MKKLTTIIEVLALLLAAPAYAGVSNIQNNGKISGVSYFTGVLLFISTIHFLDWL